MIARIAGAIGAIVFGLLLGLFVSITLSYYLGEKPIGTPVIPEPDCTRTIVMDLTYLRSDECWIVERCNSTETYESIYHGKDLKECSKFLSIHPSGGGTH
jgi:hypothetical protein